MTRLNSFVENAIATGSKTVDGIKQGLTSGKEQQDLQQLYAQLGVLVFNDAQYDEALQARYRALLTHIASRKMIDTQQEKAVSVATGDGKENPAALACRKCGAAVQQDDLFCMACGASLDGIVSSEEKACAQCGKKVDPDALFCEHCGAKQVKEPVEEDGDVLHSSETSQVIVDDAVDKASMESTVQSESLAGESVPEKDVNACKKCGAPLQDGWMFCGSCGSPRE